MARELAPLRQDMEGLRGDNVVLRADVTALREGAVTLSAQLTALTATVTTLTASVAEIRRMASLVECISHLFYWFRTDHMQTWNGSSGTGKDAELQVVPFANGDLPTGEPVTMPDFCLCDACLNIFVPAPSTSSQQIQEGRCPDSWPT